MKKFELGPHNIDKMTEYGIPDYMHGGLIRYFEQQLPPGNFLTAVLENDWMGAFMFCDDTNKACMANYAMWFCNCAPGRNYGIWGSKEAVKNWLNGEKDD